MAKKTPAPKKTSRVGRYTDPVTAGRMTPKTHTKEAEHSPQWFGVLVLQAIIFGLLVTVLNYLAVLPGSTSSWYLVVGLGSLFFGLFLATRYH
jgi:uncharacterized RDD family membrane protein YckC